MKTPSPQARLRFMLLALWDGAAEAWRRQLCHVLGHDWRHMVPRFRNCLRCGKREPWRESR
jgi:hypothetical protein